MLLTQAMAMKYIGLRESPRPRKMDARMLYAVMQGMPMKHKIRYALVPATASSGTDTHCTMEPTRPTRTAANTMDPVRNSVTVLPMSRPALALSFPPTARPMVTVVPMERPTIITVIICITWLPMDTAVVLATPSNCPMMNRSAMPYSVCRKYEKRYGREK